MVDPSEFMKNPNHREKAEVQVLDGFQRRHIHWMEMGERGLKVTALTVIIIITITTTTTTTTTIITIISFKDEYGD